MGASNDLKRYLCCSSLDRNKLQMMNYVLLFAALALVAALPLEESAVSEEAKSTVSQLLSIGKSSSACKSLADATIKEVKDSVKAAQKILDTNKDGSQCEKVGESLVSKANNSVVSASKASVDATAAANAACSAKVTFKPQSLSSLKNGKCANLFTDPAFVLAKKTCKQMKKSTEKAKGAIDGAKTALVNVKKAAKDDKKKCRCAAQKSHKVALEAAGKVNSAANKKAWDKAHNMLCVLNGQSTCKVPSLPSLRTPTLVKRAAQETCSATAAATPTTSPTTTLTTTPTVAATSTPTLGISKFVGDGICKDGVKNGEKSFPYLHSESRKMSWLECKTKALSLKDAIGFTTRNGKGPNGGLCYIFFPALDPSGQSLNCDGAENKVGSDLWGCSNFIGNQGYDGMKIAITAGPKDYTCDKIERKNE